MTNMRPRNARDLLLTLILAALPASTLADGLRQRKVTIAELDRVCQVLPSRRLRVALELRSV